MSEIYSQCPHCHYKPAVPLPISEPCPACGIYTFKWGQHRSVPSDKPLPGPSLRTRWGAADPIVRIKIGSMLSFLGAWVSVPSLASGTITLTRNGNVISRANAPLEFWFLVLSALAVAVFGAWVAIAGLINDRADSDVAALGITGDKMLLYLVLFCVLAVIYSIYLEGVIEGRREAELRDPAWPFAKVCLISALPFGVLAWFDKPWRSSDAAPVSVVAWVAVFGAFSLKYPGQCPFAAFLLFVPLVFSALVGHTVGTLCQKATSAI